MEWFAPTANWEAIGYVFLFTVIFIPSGYLLEHLQNKYSGGNRNVLLRKRGLRSTHPMDVVGPSGSSRAYKSNRKKIEKR